MDERKGIRSARRWRYADSYEMREEKGPDGRIRRTAVYVGGHLLPEHGAEAYARARRRIRLLAPAAALSLIAALALEGSSVYRGGTYALLPAAAALIPAFYGVLGAVRLPKTDARLREDEHRFGHARVKRSARGTLLFAGASLALLAAVLLGKGKDGVSLPADAILVLLAALACLSAAGQLLCLRGLRYHWEKAGEGPAEEETREDPSDGV